LKVTSLRFTFFYDLNW